MPAPSQPVLGLIDGLACLQALAAAGEPVGGRELARRLGQHHVRTNRLLMSLAAAGFARQDARRRYLPGPAFHVLAALAAHGSGLLRRALPQLEALATGSGAVVALGVLWQEQVCYLYHGSAGDALGRTSLHPAADSSIGQVLLASAGRRAFAAVRRAGHACLRHGTSEHPHLSVAVPVGDPAIAGLAATRVPVDADVASLVARLQATASAIAALETV